MSSAYEDIPTEEDITAFVRIAAGCFGCMAMLVSAVLVCVGIVIGVRL